MIRKLLSLFTETHLHFNEQEAGETVVLLLRPHRFTILYPVSFIFLLGLIPILIMVGFKETLETMGLITLFWFLTSLYYMWLWLSLFYCLTIYSLNVVIVTDRRIIENEQFGFFKRKISELHTYRVQDISVKITGMVETLLNFGDIHVQTAGSEREFTFKQIANPEEVKDRIMQVVTAHQAKVKLI